MHYLFKVNKLTEDAVRTSNNLEWGKEPILDKGPAGQSPETKGATCPLVVDVIDCHTVAGMLRSK